MSRTAWFAQTCKCHLWTPLGSKRLEGWTKRVVGSWAPRRFLQGSFSKIADLAYKSGRDGSHPSEGQVSICRGKLVVALERKKSLLLFSDVVWGFYIGNYLG
ncbi:hypothetical protein MUK42_37469 [Musa troglodytarum]|uniref:Uncharacterized protein n=1 Tax=Musa troglodytarum TaxID=320322 RepID=A0A9E7HH69_9LILI|nr:hypothetical protein MUK42_37469 [Musa troglodytarum]